MYSGEEYGLAVFEAGIPLDDIDDLVEVTPQMLSDSLGAGLRLCRYARKLGLKLPIICVGEANEANEEFRSLGVRFVGYPTFITSRHEDLFELLQAYYSLVLAPNLKERSVPVPRNVM
jgi:hypothetical protein